MTQRIKILIIGVPCAGKTTLAKYLANKFDFRFHCIDECRMLVSDGSIAGESRAYRKFLKYCRNVQGRQGMILEFSGAGYQASAVRRALIASKCDIYVLWIDPPVRDCVKRYLIERDNMDKRIPMPYFFGKDKKTIMNFHEVLNRRWKEIWHTGWAVECKRIRTKGIPFSVFDDLEVNGRN